MPFKLAQTFFIDPAIVQNAAEISITAVDLFFKSKPKADQNKSGISYPGVELYITPTINSIPLVYDVVLSRRIARREYVDIRATADASEATKFNFIEPIKLKSNQEYAIIVKYDGNEDYELWSSKQGDLLVGTTKVSPGPSGKYIGSYYTYVNGPVMKFATPPSGNSAPLVDNTNVANTADPWSGVSMNQNNPALFSWKPISDTDLKFRIYCARYFQSGTAVTGGTSGGGTSTGSGTYTFVINPNYYEYILYDKKISKKTGVRGGERAYQRTIYYPGGFGNSTGGASQSVTVSVTDGSDIVVANTRLPNGALFNWNNIFSQVNDEYIVIDLRDYNDSPKRRTNVRKVVSIESNTIIRVDDTFDLSNSVAKFFVSPVGTVDFRDKSRSFGKQTDLLVLENSNANLSHRFVNNSIEQITVKTAGSGYSNTDYIIINGYENVPLEVVGGYPARANIVVNGSGAIQNIYLSNLGCGYVNTSWLAGANIVIANSSGGNSSGSGAVFNYSIGSTIGTEFHGDDGKGGFYKTAQIINLEIGDMISNYTPNHSGGTNYKMNHQIPFYVKASPNTYAGKTYFVNEDSNKNRNLIKTFKKHNLPFDNTPIMPSRSNQFIILNGNSSSNSVTGGSNTTIEFTSNNDFVCIDIPPTSHSTTYSKYIINNDYTNENTDTGEAFAKHITKKVTFANNKFAEDLLIFLTAYRPANTDIKVFARVHNSDDPEAFDDKDWTMLELSDGNDLYSSPDNEKDYIELTYGFQSAPNTTLRVAGTANVENTSTTTVIGSGSSYLSNSAFSLNVGDVVKISQPLFPDSYVVRVVDSVASDTNFTINKPVANDDLVGAGLNVDFIGRIGNSTVSSLGYPLQAFNNITNDNVVRYFNTSMVEYDTFNTMQIKIVLLSEATENGVINVYPKVDDIRAVGVST